MPKRVNRRLSIVVPVLNEADGVGLLRKKLNDVQNVLSEFGTVELVFVDDGSTDGTLRLLSQAFPEGDCCRILSHQRNLGVGAAFRTGFRSATGSIVCTIDADCSYEPEGLKKLIEAMDHEGADIAVASPYHPAGAVQDVGAWRLLLSKVCSGIYRLISPVPLFTYTSIFRAYRWNVVEDVEFEANGFVSAAEILIHAADQGYRIVEVPMVLRGRKVGTTKMKILRTIGRHLSMMSKLLARNFQPAGHYGSRRPVRTPSVQPLPPATAYQFAEKE